MPYTIALLYGSVRTARKGIHAARFLETQLSDRGHTVRFIDPMEYPLPLLDKMYKEFSEGTAPPNMEKVGRWMAEADGYLMVTGEYNNSIPPALKNLIDHYQTEYFFKPAAIASYSSGAIGGARSSIQMRIILGELGMVSMSTILNVPKVQTTIDEQGNTENKALLKQSAQLIDELEWYLKIMTPARKKGTPF